MDLDTIIQGCKEGNRASQDALVRKFAPGLLSLCVRYTSDYDLGRDALQESFISIFRSIHQYNGQGSFEGWIRKIAVRAALGLKKKFRAFRFEAVTEEEAGQYAAIPDIYTDMNTEDILALMLQLPETLYLVFNLYVVEGYQHREIADILGITESTSRASLFKARNRMITLLEQQTPKTIKSSIYPSSI